MHHCSVGGLRKMKKEISRIQGSVQPSVEIVHHNSRVVFCVFCVRKKALRSACDAWQPVRALRFKQWLLCDLQQARDMFKYFILEMKS